MQLQPQYDPNYPYQTYGPQQGYAQDELRGSIYENLQNPQAFLQNANSNFNFGGQPQDTYPPPVPSTEWQGNQYAQHNIAPPFNDSQQADFGATPALNGLHTEAKPAGTDVHAKKTT